LFDLLFAEHNSNCKSKSRYDVAAYKHLSENTLNYRHLLLSLSLFALAIIPALAQDTPDSDIFAKLWSMPESHISVTKLGDDGKPLDGNAIVIVNEQGKAGRCLQHDNAPKPLLTITDESFLEEPTFKTLIALFDNYTAAEQQPEVSWDDTSHHHWTEVDAFLDAVFDSPTMKVAVAHIQKELSPGISIEQIRKDTRAMWFEPYTNRYSAANKFCVGFEHVFIGEDESNLFGADPCRDAVGGYHSWVKFYVEKKKGKVNYLGYDYPEGNVADAIADPKVTTMVMRWSPTKEEDGSYGNDLMKKPGGFFVGTRPELEIAFGTLAMYSQLAGKYDNVPGKENHHRVRLGENLFDIVMHPQSLAPPKRGQKSKRGKHIRTLYPKFRGKEIPNFASASKVDLPTQPHNNAAIKIVSALVNPAGAEDDGEWVELKNVTDDAEFDLSSWSLCDRNGRRLKLTGNLKAGETLKATLTRTNEQSMMLRNGGGWILLFQDDVRRAGVEYDRASESEVVKF